MGSAQHVINWRRRVKQQAVVYKGGQCVVCGYNRCPWALAFHHLDPTQKDFNVSATTVAWATIKAELDKCVLLCCRCHIEAHHGVLDLAPHLDKNPSPDEGDRFLSQTGLSPRPTTAQRVIVCPDCGATKHARAVRCRRCAARSRPQNVPVAQWPPLDVLKQMVSDTSFVAVGRLLGVSDNAVRKRIKRHR